MENLDGPTSRRIRDGDIPKAALSKGRTIGDEEPPTVQAIRNAEGHGLGRGATKARNGMGYDRHVESVAVAKAAIEELQSVLQLAREKSTDALGTVAMAVGDTPHVESAQNIVGFVASVQEQLIEMVGITAAAMAELDRYAGGF